MRRWRRSRAAGLITAAVMVATWSGPAAAQPYESRQAPEPSNALLVGGLVLAVGGGALQYYGVHRFAGSIEGDGDGIYSFNPGWILLSSLGNLATLGGGAMTAAWGWKRGEHDLARDLATRAPIQDRRSLGILGLGIGAAVLIGQLVAQTYVFSKSMGCIQDSEELNTTCATDAIKATTLVQLAGNAVLLVVAPMAGYGFGYDSAADRNIPGRRQGFSGVSLVPAYLAAGRGLGGPGFALTGRF